MTIYLVYKTTNKSNGKYYIGKHKCQSLNDGYLGSGTALKEAINKYGRDNFIRETLATFDTEDEAFAYEQSIVNPDDPLCYNIKTGGLGGHSHAKESKTKMSKNMKGRIPWNKGKKIWSDEQKAEIGSRTKGKKQDPEFVKRRIAARVEAVRRKKSVC